jgi:hypothetical protein
MLECTDRLDDAQRLGVRFQALEVHGDELGVRLFRDFAFEAPIGITRLRTAPVRTRCRTKVGIEADGHDLALPLRQLSPRAPQTSTPPRTVRHSPYVAREVRREAPASSWDRA